ncbi:related to orc3p [Lichtheimia corymbifera JMRC:FSU:9682]|uniref:Related to orc3p n=1 Tax=Lichtheimia corymbifera JMRC:FSU:9682 TaxID=1263082 RepID=A0A068RR31_9FUNG|nr:related to orc3p [Lichtheimia corymbifera JMRC:FSU:9682]
MDYDSIDYFFDDASSFHAELDDILRLPCVNKQDAERITTQYLRLWSRFQDEFCQSQTELAHCAYQMIDSHLFLEHSTTILSHITQAHALSASDPHDLRIAYSLLIYAGKEDPRWMKFVVSDARRNKQNRLFRKIINEPIIASSVGLAFEMCKVSKLRQSDLGVVSCSFLNSLLDMVESMLQDADESFNYDIIQFILVLNEQYMMAGTQTNRVLDMLEERMGTATTFSANLIFMLNRSDDACVKLLILKLLYGIFTRPSLYEFFYTNDLYVLVDIMLREVCDLGEEREAEALRDAYLRVLRPLLINTQLRRTPYKETEIRSTLCAMIAPCNYRIVNPSTNRLVERILEEWTPSSSTLLDVNPALINRTPSPYPMLRSPASFSSSSSSIQTPDDERDQQVDTTVLCAEA